MADPVVAILTANSQTGSGALRWFLEEASKVSEGSSSKKSFKLRGVVRSEEVAQRLRKEHEAQVASGLLEIVSGVDAHSIDSVQRALAGVRAAVLVTPTTADRGQLTQNMILAAKLMGVEFISLITSWTVHGVHPLFKQDFGSSEALATELFGETRSSFLRGGFFDSNFLGFAPLIKSKGIIPLPLEGSEGLPRLPFVDPESIGAVAAVEILKYLNDEPIDHFVEVTGPKALSGAEVAEVFSNLLERKVSFVSVPLETAMQGFAQHHSEWETKFVEAVWKVLLHDKPAEVEEKALKPSGDVLRLTGKSYPFEDWLRNHLDAFR